MDLQFRVEDKDPVLAEHFYRRVEMTCPAGTFVLPVCDDMDDLPDCAPAIILQLVLRALYDFEEAQDYLVWCKEMGYSAGDSTASRIWFEQREVAAWMLQFFGDLKPISTWDWEMGAGECRILRGI